MAELASDPERTARLGHQAREFVSSKFRRKTHIHELIRIYEQTLRHDSRAQRKFSV
jgi:glycosyltransferase involved in cell wall biosynthesis